MPSTPASGKGQKSGKTDHDPRCTSELAPAPGDLRIVQAGDVTTRLLYHEP